MAQITRQGIPDRKTKGALGDIYVDSNTGKKYRCTGSYAFNTFAESKAEYEWRPIVEDVVEKKSTPSDNRSENKKVDQVVKPAFVKPDITPVTDIVEEVKPERRQSKVSSKGNGKNYNKYYQQKKTADN